MSGKRRSGSRRLRAGTTTQSAGGGWPLAQLLICLMIFGTLLLVKALWPGSAKAVNAFVGNYITDGWDIKATFTQAFGGKSEDKLVAATQAPTTTIEVFATPSVEPTLEATPAPTTEPTAETAVISALAYQTETTDEEDDTWPLPFNLPKPDVVDFTDYQVTFAHVNPLKSMTITSDFGYRTHPIDGVYSFHYGIDLGGASGTKIMSYAAGEVYEVGNNGVYGNYIRVRHANGFTTFYGHCQKIIAREGDAVQPGDVIALVGETGKATGPHLHFEIRHEGLILDPTRYLDWQEGKAA